MSRLASLLIVLLAIAVATPVLAEDRLSLSGAMRVRGFHIDVDGADSTDTFANQRLRIGGKLSVAEGVSVSFRTDITEATWGSQAGGARLGSTGTNVNIGAIHFDRAHIDLQNDMLHLRAGEQKFDLGGTYAFDNQSTGLLLNVKGAVPVTIFGAVDDTNGASTDALTFGVNVGHKTDAYAANVYAAAQRDSSRDYSFQGVDFEFADEELYLVGLNYAQNLDILKLFAELNYFTGDVVATELDVNGNPVATGDADAYGLQAFVDVSTAVAETVTVGGQFFYAMGKDDEAQITHLGNGFDGWDPIFTLGTSSNLTTSSIWGYDSVYNVLGNGAGIYAGRIYTHMKATDQISLAASVLFGTADEKDSAGYKDIMAVAAGMKYDIMPKTFINFQVQYRDLSKENLTDDLERFDVGTALVVNF